MARDRASAVRPCRAEVDVRERVDACLHLEKAGCPWRFLPGEFGPRQTVRGWHDRSGPTDRGPTSRPCRPGRCACSRAGHDRRRPRHAAGGSPAGPRRPGRPVRRARRGGRHPHGRAPGAGLPGARPGRPGHDARGRGEGLRAAAAALAHRGDLRHACPSPAPPIAGIASPAPWSKVRSPQRTPSAPPTATASCAPATRPNTAWHSQTGSEGKEGLHPASICVMGTRTSTQ